MSTPAEDAGTDRTDEQSSAAEFERGRYLYCLVDPTREDAPDEFEAEGLDEQPAYVIREDGLAAVVHACESTYDDADPNQVRRWLLAHQRVVDEAGEAYGTPIPFRFHTILPGDDETVREWLSDVHDEARRHLAGLAGRWEYRISLDLDDEQLAARLATEDEELRSLRARKEQADSGKSFLLDKQYDQRLRQRKRAREEELLEELRQTIAPHVERAEALGRRRATLEGQEPSDEPAQRVATLVDEDRIDALGEALDDLAAAPGLEVTFTGPWPPYTFAPELAEDGEDDGLDGG